MNSIQDVYSNDDKEIWWDTKIKTSPTSEHNKPDIVSWLKKEKKCYIIDININRNIDQKHDTYFQLSVQLKRLYKDYTFEVIPTILGATGAITKHLTLTLEKISIENRSHVIRKYQMKSALRTMKLVKSVMKL